MASYTFTRTRCDMFACTRTDVVSSRSSSDTAVERLGELIEGVRFVDGVAQLAVVA